MISQIEIKLFKSIEEATLDLGRINVIIGANNAGKSSIIQALQFATSIAQASKIYSPKSLFSETNMMSTTISPEQLIYAPLKDVYALAYNGVLKENIEQAIHVSFTETEGEQTNRITVAIRKGRNKNLAIRFEGSEIYSKLSSLETPYCMYVPGLSGIPFEEEIRPIGAIRRASAKGDSNTVFRNILYRLNENRSKWQSFIEDIHIIFPLIDISVSSNENVDGIINVAFRLNANDEYRPIDLAGTGVLQAIQIAAYINFFEPSLLLLDEPDSHLHPDNQRLLAVLLVNMTRRRNLSAIVSTHSRHLMNALKDDARFFMIKSGCMVDADYSHYGGLLELGALDEYDKIKAGAIKYVVLTEDSSAESHRYLANLLCAAGYAKEEYIIYSYNSVSKIESANLFAQFLIDLHPDLRVIIHRDRDGLYSSELIAEKSKYCQNARVLLFITCWNDLEMYFCTKEHIQILCSSLDISISESDIIEIVSTAISNAKDISQVKLINHRSELERKNDNKAQIAMMALSQYESSPIEFAYGKSVSGYIAARIQEISKRNIDLFQYSHGLKCETLFAFHEQ